MPIDPRLAFGAMEGIQQPIGRNIVSGLKTYNAMQDRQREEQERAQMQSLGQFVGQELAGGTPDYNAISGRIAEFDPLKALDMRQNMLQSQRDFDIAKLKNAPKQGLDPTFLNNAAASKYQARQLLESIKNEKDPALKQESIQKYNQLQQSYATATKPNILGLKDSTNKLKELEILPYDDALQSNLVRRIDTSMKQSQLNEQLRSGSIKDEKFISESIKAYETLANQGGMGLAKVSNISGNLEKLYKMAKVDGNVAAMHALNIIANKALDPDSAVLLAEANAFTSQDWATEITKLGKKISGDDPRLLNIEDLYKMARGTIGNRMKNAQYLANRRKDFINSQLGHMGSTRRITIEDISPFAKTPKPSWEEIKK
jgi:hypothetical protein